MKKTYQQIEIGFYEQVIIIKKRFSALAYFNFEPLKTFLKQKYKEEVFLFLVPVEDSNPISTGYLICFSLPIFT